MGKTNETVTISPAQPSDKGFYSCEVNTTGFKPAEAKAFKVIVIGKCSTHKHILK